MSTAIFLLPPTMAFFFFCSASATRCIFSPAPNTLDGNMEPLLDASPKKDGCAPPCKCAGTWICCPKPGPKSDGCPKWGSLICIFCFLEAGSSNICFSSNTSNFAFGSLLYAGLMFAAAISTAVLSGTTPPPAIVARISVFSSSSFLIDIIRCLGLMRFFCFLSCPSAVFFGFRCCRAVLPAISSSSAMTYSITAARYTDDELWSRHLCGINAFSSLCTFTTGKMSPALFDRFFGTGIPCFSLSSLIIFSFFLSLSFFGSLSLSLCFSFSFSLCFSFSLPSLSFLSLSNFSNLSLSLSLSFALSLSLSFPSLYLSLSLYLSFSLNLSLSLNLSFSLNLSLSLSSLSFGSLKASKSP
mmetsp:Transcript_20877/g.52751  ORF Transcript_20877/g.52751 Transcript_20877/m.52751 type:complete len:356 (-) Transcript_20877:250-1317(-)